MYKEWPVNAQCEWAQSLVLQDPQHIQLFESCYPAMCLHRCVHHQCPADGCIISVLLIICVLLMDADLLNYFLKLKTNMRPNWPVGPIVASGVQNTQHQND